MVFQEIGYWHFLNAARTTGIGNIGWPREIRCKMAWLKRNNKDQDKGLPSPMGKLEGWPMWRSHESHKHRKILFLKICTEQISFSLPALFRKCFLFIFFLSPPPGDYLNAIKEIIPCCNIFLFVLWLLSLECELPTWQALSFYHAWDSIIGEPPLL